MDIKLLSDYEASHDLYRLIRLLAPRVGSPIEHSKISSILGINRNKVKQYLQLLETTFFILPIAPFTNNIDREIRQRKKIYLADTGLLNVLAKVNYGQVFENAIAIQLRHIGEVNYFQKSNGHEIDFILNREIAFEVKQTPTPQDLHKLKTRANSLKLESQFLIGKNPPKGEFIDFLWGGNLVEN